MEEDGPDRKDHLGKIKALLTTQIELNEHLT